jgi:prepilin peptidase CpaA
MSLPAPALCVALILVAGLAAGYDLRSRRIPNWVSLAGWILGLGLNAVLFRWVGLRLALLGTGMALLIYLPMLLIRGVGAGDVKLMAAIGAILGPNDWIAVFILSAVTGGAVGLVLIVFHRRGRRTLQNVGRIFRSLARLQTPFSADPSLDVAHPDAMTLPHAAIIGAGAIEFIILTAWALPHG